MLSREIPGILPVNPEGGKVARAAAVSPLIEAGNIYLPHPLWAPWVSDFIEECAAFPNGAHDDQVDAMTQALLRWNMVVEQETVIYLPDYPTYQISPI
jgi:predicted phage terminase large subunit-like protein